MMNKKRLAALALSAVMAASTVSVPVNAADLFSDGTAATVNEAQPQSGFTSGTDATANNVETEVPAEESADAAAATAEVAAPVEEATEAAGDHSHGTTEVDEKSIVFYYEDVYKGTVMEYSYKGDSTRYTVPAVKDETKCKPATCTKAEEVWLKAYVGEDEYLSTHSFEGEPALGELGHKWTTQDDWITHPTHNHDGWKKVVTTCSVCDTTNIELVKVEPIAHTWSEKPVYLYVDNVKTDEDGYVVFDENGDAVLIDDSRDGYYKEVYYCTDEDCAAERKTEWDLDRASKSETKVEYAKTGIYAKIIGYDTKHIKTDLTDGRKYYNPTKQLPLDEDAIELYDCRVGGWYIVEYYNKDGKPLSREEKITVNPHHYHVFKTAEFENKTDADQCTVSRDADGNLVIKNNSCYRTITYNEVSHCEADGCYGKEHEVKAGCEKDNCGETKFFDKVEKEAAPAGVHVIREEVYNEINRQMNDRVESKLLTYAGLLKTIARFGAEDYVKLSAAPDCEVGGTVTVSYICMLDKETVVKTQEVKVVADEHKKAPAISENVVEPTCAKPGTYDSVIKCEYCGKELSREEKQIARLPHTNEVESDYDNFGDYTDDTATDTTAYLKFTGDKVVDTNGEALKNKVTAVGEETGSKGSETFHYVGKYAKENGAYRDSFAVSVKVYTNCTECGEHEIALNAQSNVSLKIVDVQKEASNGKAGSITLEAAYKKINGEKITETYTVPYFSTIEAYNGRLEDPATPLNGLHWDKDGECRYYVDNVLQKDFSGILEYAGKSFLLKDGVLCKDASGLTPIDNEWYYLTEGRIRTDVTQVVMYDGEWFYVTNGKLDTSVNDLVLYDGETFVFVEGRLAQEGNGLWIGKEGVWYFLSDGRVAREHTGLAMYDNEWFYVVNGKLAADYSGTVEYNGGTFKVDHGMLKGQVK